MAAYLYLQREVGYWGVRTEPVDEGLPIDFTQDGGAIAVEFFKPSKVDIGALYVALAKFGQDPIRPEELTPLAAA